MRVVLALVVIAAMAFVGLQAVSRMTERQQPVEERATATAVATGWAGAVGAGDVEELVDLAATDRADEEEVRSAHEEILPQLGTVTVDVVGVTEDGNQAVATLAYEAAPVEGASWRWETDLELIRSRGEWSADWEPSALHPELRPGWRLAVRTVEGTRAPVLDRDGQALSRTGEVVEVGVQPGRLPDRSRVLLTVANALPAAFEPLQELLDRDDLRDDWYYPLTTVPVDVADEAWPDLLTLTGFQRRDAEAGTGEAAVAPHIVGSVGLDEDGERIGTSGLEQLYDDRLTGSATTAVRLLDPDGGDRGVLFEYQQDVSPPLVTTLDTDVQRTVEDVVEAQDGPLGVVAVDPATGGVVAVASRPDSDFSWALEGRYPPAAVAGIVPLAAAFSADASLGDALACPASGTAGGVTVTTRAPRSDERATLAEALTGACDVGVARLGAAYGGEALVEATRLLGLDREVALPVPAVGMSWPPTSTEAADASASIGHAQVQSSALGAASLAAGVARGAPAPPFLVEGEQPAVEPWPDGVTRGLREVMRTAGAAGDVGAPGVRVAGLTAAAGQVRGDPAPTTGWWVGFLEGDAPDLALAVVVEGDEDGRTATAIADTIVGRLAG